jgi:hypothetical protein
MGKIIIGDPGFRSDEEKRRHLPGLKPVNPDVTAAQLKAEMMTLMTYNAATVATDKAGIVTKLAGNEQGFIGVTLKCPKNRHLYAKPVWACAHCTDQDPVHPEGMVLSDKGYYACKTCWDRITSSRWRWWEQMTAQCHHCVQDEVERILRLDPTKFVDHLRASLVRKGLVADGDPT